MIIFGTRGVKSTMAQGNFHCPQCNTEVPYKHKQVRRFFTLYFIPVIPLDRVGDYVECQQCRGTFVERVLNYTPGPQNDQEFLSEFQKAVKKVLMKIVLADGVVDEKEKDMLSQILKKISGVELSGTALETELEEVKRDMTTAPEYLRNVSAYLNDAQKELIIKAGIMIAASDGDVDDTEINMINKLGASMDMSKHHINAVVASLMEKE